MTIERLLCFGKIYQIKIIPKRKIKDFPLLSPVFENNDVNIILIKEYYFDNQCHMKSLGFIDS